MRVQREQERMQKQTFEEQMRAQREQEIMQKQTFEEEKNRYEKELQDRQLNRKQMLQAEEQRYEKDLKNRQQEFAENVRLRENEFNTQQKWAQEQFAQQQDLLSQQNDFSENELDIARQETEDLINSKKINEYLNTLSSKEKEYYSKELQTQLPFFQTNAKNYKEIYKNAQLNNQITQNNIQYDLSKNSQSIVLYKDINKQQDNVKNNVLNNSFKTSNTIINTKLNIKEPKISLNNKIIDVKNIKPKIVVNVSAGSTMKFS